MLGAFIVGLLALTGTTAKVTLVTSKRTDSLYAADGGADFALEQIRTTATSSCPPTVTAPPAVNGVSPTISVTCSGGTTSGSGSALLGTYSAIALGPSGITVGGSVQDGDALTVKFQGDVYSGGTIAPLTGTANRVVIQGNAALKGTPCSFNSTTDPQVTGTCTANAAVPTVAATSPKVVIPAATAPAAVTSGTCTIYYPGTYTTAPTFTAGQGYYLASGTYYFNGTGDISVNGGWIQGGAPGTTTPTMSTGFTSRCPTSYANDTNAKTLRSAYNYTGTGVTIILGGNAVLRYQDNADIKAELFPRVPTTGSPDTGANETPGVTIWGQGTTHGTTGATGTYTKMTQSNAYYSNGKTADVVTHGLLWLPDSVVQTSPLPNTDAGGSGQLKGGVVAYQLLLWCDNITGGVTSTVAGTVATVAAPRTMTITSTATQSGSATTTVKVVATYPTTANGYPTIVSWRKV